ncbi:MAG: ferritin-like domain-containing protein [Pirellulales bacterium]
MRRERTSADWIDYFDANDAAWADVPFHRGAEVALDQVRPLMRSLQAWQLGETSEAKQLKAAAKRHAYAVGDPDFVEAMKLFILEEQRHGESLGRWLDAVGAGRIRRDWGDSLFRWCRHSRPNLEVWTTIVTIVEVLAVVYYSSVRRAIPCPVLKAICAQIIRDEIPHLEFQTQRLRMLYARRRPNLLRLTMLGYRLLFTGTTLTVWFAHRRMFVAGGHGFFSYWRTALRHMQSTWQAMQPVREGEPMKGARPVKEMRTLEATSPSRVARTMEPPSRLEGWLH